MNTIDILKVVVIIISAILSILAIALIAPEKKRSSQGWLLRSLADIINFKHFLIESILKFIYVAATIFTFIMSLILCVLYLVYGDITRFAICLLIFAVSPFAIRIAYEFIMLLIILVKNVTEINNKLTQTPTAAQPQPGAYQQYVFPQQPYVQYTQPFAPYPNQPFNPYIYANAPANPSSGTVQSEPQPVPKSEKPAEPSEDVKSSDEPKNEHN